MFRELIALNERKFLELRRETFEHHLIRVYPASLETGTCDLFIVCKSV